MEYHVNDVKLYHVRFWCAVKPVMGNFQIGKIYAEAKIHQPGKFVPQEIYPLYGTHLWTVFH